MVGVEGTKEQRSRESSGMVGRGGTKEQRCRFRGILLKGTRLFSLCQLERNSSPPPQETLHLAKMPGQCSISRAFMSPNRNMNRDYPIGNSPILKYAVPLSPRACFNLSRHVFCLVWKMHSLCP